ncbi:MAG TPA: prohibitin family protein [candidate division WOR-3 bacterium]|uniref:Prohibitin family protein n=1 Tax=candidate division WOR-3 bacterium TaxID=2052148 RepID=A0A7V0T5E3_UNCW3|nr:prohibitin family protein [candidate division WOR-3 bacterium]
MLGILMLVTIAAIIAYVAIRQSGRGRLIARRAGIALIVVIAIVFGLSFFRIVPPGHAGVPVLLGRVQNQLSSGLNVVIPIVNVVLMDVRTNAYTMSSIREEGLVKGDDAIEALAADGLTVEHDVTVWFRLDVTQASWVYQNIGPDYAIKIVRPSIRTALRDAASRFTASELYSSGGRAVYTTVVDSLLDEAFTGRGIVRERVLLRRVKLPSIVMSAIEEKLAEEQRAEAMQFTLQKERREAERKEIEAAGIAGANRTIAGSLTSSYLTWYYVEALKKVADGDNNTFVVMPFDQKLTPLLNVR